MTPAPPTAMPRLSSGMVVILLVAAVLRAWNVGFGLPAVYNPDEVAIMNRAVALGQNGLNPHNFLYPSLYFYVLFAWEGLWFVVGLVTGQFSSLADFERAYFVDPTSIYVAGRLLSVVAGVATVWATWRLGSRLFGPRVGQVAALLLAVAPLAVRDAHYVKHDVPVTLLVVLAMGAIVKAAESGRQRDWMIAGIVAGLAMSTHYYALFVVLPGIVLCLHGRGSRQAGQVIRDLGYFLVAAGVAFVATSPFLLVEWQTALRDITANRQIVIDRATGSGGLLASLGYYATWLASDGVGLVTTVLALIGLVALTRTGFVPIVSLVVFPVAFLLFIANTVPASRYLNPVLPFAAVLAGLAVDRLARSPGGFLRLLAGMLIAAATVQATTASLRVVSFFGQTDTRTLAREWIEREVPAEASVLVQPYSVPLQQSRAALDEALTHHLGSPEKASVKFQRQRALTPYPAPAYRLIYLGSGGLDVDRIYLEPQAFDRAAGLEPLRSAAVTYVVLKRYNEPDPSMASLSRALEERARLVATFSPYRTDADPLVRAVTPPFLHNTDVRVGAALERPGPIVDVWRLD